MKSRLVFAVVLLVLARWAGLAQAQLRDCPPFDPTHTAAYTMFLDEIARSGSTSTERSVEKTSLDTLVAQVQASLHLSLGDGGPSVEWKTCLGRFPKLGDFTARVRRDLLQYGVVLEIYGDSDGRRMALRHAIIPAMYEQNDIVVQLDNVPLSGEGNEESDAINKYRAHLLGYMEVAVGLRLSLAVGRIPDQQQKRQLAQRWMCEGVRLIFGGDVRPTTKLAPDQAVLLDTLARHMSGLPTSPAYDQVRELLHHGPTAQPNDAGSLVKNACLGPRS